MLSDLERLVAIDADLPFSSSGFKGYGHYHETYVRIGGQWRIQTSKLTRLRVTFQ